jgi:predicted Ser/Thr protein kinase
MKSGSDLGQEPGGTAKYSPGPIPPSLEELAQQFPQLEILELLGQGGMGIVYKARQPRLDRFVALKILPVEAGRDPAFAERFAREARALAKLTHPGIVTVYDFGESDGRFYLLMEFVDGVNLRHLLRERPLKPDEALQIVPQLCEALQYAHEQGVIHRDIKPENILLDKRGQVKIADFGLAKLLGQKAEDSALTGSHQVMGTPHYMAPEQLERPLTVDHRADIYSLGVVFYEMLTGELPLGRFAPPSQKVQVDVRLDEVVLRALEKEPERRYQHASEVKAEVESITHTVSQPERPTAASDQRQPPLDAKAEELERLVLSLMPDNEWAAIRAYVEQAGVPLDHAAAAVEAIARRHGITPRPVPVVAHLLAGLFVLALIIVTLGYVAAIWAWRQLDFSPLITVPLGVLLLLVGLWLAGRAWRYRGTSRGRWPAFWAFWYWYFLIGIPLLSFLGNPEPVLNRLYELTGIAPGRHDVAFFQTLLGVGLIGALFWLLWFVRKQRVGQRGRTAEKPEPAPLDAEAEQLERLVLPFLPEHQIAAIQAYRQQTGASLVEAKEAVEAMARKHGLPLSPASLLNSPSTCGILLCVLGIAASFVPAVTRHLEPHSLSYEMLAPGQPAGSQQWVAVPDTGMFGWGGEFSWEWTSIPATFLALGLFLIGTHAVRRMASLRAFVMLVAGTVVLVLDVVRVRPVHGSAELYTTPYLGSYLVGALAVGLLLLGVMALRFALLNTNPDADTQAMNFLRRKLHSLWESALSLCVGSRVQGATSNLTGDHRKHAPLSGTALEEQEAGSSEAHLPGATVEADPVGGSPIMPGKPTSDAPPALPPEPSVGSGRSTRKVAIAVFLIILGLGLMLLFVVG